MRDSEELYTVTGPWSDIPPGLHLVIALTGFRDSGAVVGQVTESLLEGTAHETVVKFKPDELFDYRSRRPTVLIEGTKLRSLTLPKLELHVLQDEVGTQFLLLAGGEPDFRWNAVVDGIIHIIDRLQIATTTWLHSMPMPVPHTRPVQFSATGNRPELLEALSVWEPHTEAPAHILHLLEYCLANEGHPVIGLVALIPHYVADAAVPAGALAALAAIGTATGLILGTEELREADRIFRNQVDSQVESNSDVAKLIRALETQHDSYLADSPQRSGFASASGELPSADELAAEIERYLALKGRNDPDEQSDAGGGKRP